MSAYDLPQLSTVSKAGKGHVLLIANGDLREAANSVCWPAQQAMEQALAEAVQAAGYQLTRAHPYDAERGHGFIASQREGMDVFRRIDADAPLIVAEAVWQYSHHILHGLISHRGPILTLANWSGQWPGLVGMLNLNGSLTKAGVRYATLWGDDFREAGFRRKLHGWLSQGRIKHRMGHATPLKKLTLPSAERRLGEALATQLQREKAIMGVFDEGCMGMFNAIIPDHLLHATGVFKERLSQSALYHATTQVPDADSRAVYNDLKRRGITFHFGHDDAEDLTERQVITQCKMYVAALRLADEYGCDAIGIQYQQGLKDLLPASDLVEGMLNNADRPEVRAADGSRILYENQPLPHFNEVDECAGLDALITHRVHNAMRQPPETTLHDIRWGDWDCTGTVKDYVWVFLISGAAPPAHFIDGWQGAHAYRQPPMYFRLGGATLAGVSKPGEIVWSRIFVAHNRLNMDLGRAASVQLPDDETQRRLEATTPQWPIMHAVTYGISRDQMMARHKANHIQVAYAHGDDDADRILYAKAAMADALGIHVNICGTRKDALPWP